MPEIFAAIIGALIGSITTLAWETVLKPRRERTSVAAALNAEVAFVLMTVDRTLLEPGRHEIPISFQAPTTVYRALSSRLGELPSDLSFVLAALYSALDEANALPGHYQTAAQHREGIPGQLALNEMQRLTSRFYSVLESVDASARLAHGALDKLAPGVRLELPERAPDHQHLGT